MSDGTLMPTAPVLSVSTFIVEHSFMFETGKHRLGVKFSDFPKISTLKSLFASVVVTNVVAEIRQNTMASGEDGFLNPSGHIFVGLIPTNRDSEAFSGSTALIVCSVPNKQTFPLSSTTQSNEVFNFNLNGYELDLAQDPRRGAGPVAWLGNSGVKSAGKVVLPICTVTWRISVDCAGTTPLWQ